MMRKLLALLSLLAAWSACAAAGKEVTITLPAGSKPPQWVTQADGSMVLTLLADELKVKVPSPAATDLPPSNGPVAKKQAAPSEPPAANSAPVAGAEDPANPWKAKVVEAFNAKGTAAVKDFGNYVVDMSVPASPAFVALGATPQTLINPKSPRDLAVSVVGDLKDSSKLGKGIGFDINPLMLFMGPSLELNTYQTRDEVRLLANTQVSFAAIKQDPEQGSTAASTTKISGGLSTVLFDADDARSANSALARCFNEKYTAVNDLKSKSTIAWVQEVLNNQMKGISGDVTAETSPLFAAATKKLSEAYDECRNQFKVTSWNSTRWTAGAAQAFHNRGGGTHAGQTGFWTTYSYNLNNDTKRALGDRSVDGRAQALFHYRRTNREEVASTTDARGFELRRGDMFGVGLKYGSDKRNFTAEFSVQRGKFDSGGSETSRKLAVGGELMVTKDIWLVATIGGQGGQKNGNNSPFVLGGLKFGSASESTGAFGNGKPASNAEKNKSD